MPGLLEERWMTFDDSKTNGTIWLNEQGQKVVQRKAELLPIQRILSDKYLTFLPEYYLREQPLHDGLPSFDYTSYQARDVPASILLKAIGGNSGLTEEYLYSLLLHQGERKYRLLTGSIDVERSPRIHLCQHPKNPDRTITVFSGEAIHVVRKGKAGHVNYLKPDDYTLNDDAYLLVDSGKHGCKLSLEWLVATHRHVFREYASNSDNGTWNMGGFFAHATFDIPSYDQQELALKGDITNSEDETSLA